MKRLKWLARNAIEMGTRTKVWVFLFLNVQRSTQNEGLVVLGQSPRTCFVGSIKQSVWSFLIPTRSKHLYFPQNIVVSLNIMLCLN